MEIATLIQKLEEVSFMKSPLFDVKSIKIGNYEIECNPVEKKVEKSAEVKKPKSSAKRSSSK